MTLEELVDRKPKGTEITRTELETPEFLEYDRTNVKPMIDKMLEGYDRAMLDSGSVFVR
jgi:hypothetical protein